ncbi:hypothetical protein STEG23_018687, partial [Scotinomys teguina]
SANQDLQNRLLNLESANLMQELESINNKCIAKIGFVDNKYEYLMDRTLTLQSEVVTTQTLCKEERLSLINKIRSLESCVSEEHNRWYDSMKNLESQAREEVHSLEQTLCARLQALEETLCKHDKEPNKQKGTNCKFLLLHERDLLSILFSVGILSDKNCTAARISELMSVAPVTSKGYVDDWGPVSHLRPCRCLRTMPLPAPYQSGWLVLPPGSMESPGQLSRTMSKSVSIYQPESRVMSTDPATTESSADVQSLVSHLGHGDVWEQADAEIHVWIHGLTTAGVCDDVCGPVRTGSHWSSALLSQPCPSLALDSWPCHLLDTTAKYSERMVPSLITNMFLTWAAHLS